MRFCINRAHFFAANSERKFMIILNGKYNTAKIFTDNIDEDAISQIITLCNQPIKILIYELCRTFMPAPAVL